MKNLPIRTKLITAFSLVALVASTHIVIQNIYAKRLDETKSYAQEIEELKSLILQGSKVQSDFLTKDLIDDRFYLHGKSENLFRYESIYEKGRLKFKELASHPIAEKGNIPNRIQYLKSSITSVDRKFKELVASRKKKKNHDFGTTGDIRNYAH